MVPHRAAPCVSPQSTRPEQRGRCTPGPACRTSRAARHACARVLPRRQEPRPQCATPSRAEPSRAEPSRAEPSRAMRAVARPHARAHSRPSSQQPRTHVLRACSLACIIGSASLLSLRGTLLYVTRFPGQRIRAMHRCLPYELSLRHISHIRTRVHRSGARSPRRVSFLARARRFFAFRKQCRRSARARHTRRGRREQPPSV